MIPLIHRNPRGNNTWVTPWCAGTKGFPETGAPQVCSAEAGVWAPILLLQSFSHSKMDHPADDESIHFCSSSRGEDIYAPISSAQVVSRGAQHHRSTWAERRSFDNNAIINVSELNGSWFIRKSVCQNKIIITIIFIRRTFIRWKTCSFGFIIPRYGYGLLQANSLLLFYTCTLG